MARQNVERLAFNRGVISPLALARVDVKRVSLSAEEQTNWMPRVLGPMSLRPGLQFIGGTHLQQAARYLPFIFSVTDTALIELTPNLMRVLVDDSEVTRPATATSTVTNGNFTTDLTGWTDNGEGVFTPSVWVTGGYMSLRGDGTLAAIRDQAVALSGTGEHSLRIVVSQGVLLLRVGSTSGDDDYISETSLGVGTHSLTFTPAGTFHIRLFNRDDYPTYVDSCTIGNSGALQLPTPWGADDLSNIRFVQSGDIIFVACAGIRPMKIERRSTTSWSVVDYAPTDGPFLVENLTSITMIPSGITDAITLTASKAYFKGSNVGSLIRMASNGQARDKSLGTENVYSDAIRISGLTAERNLHILTTGTWTATLTLQRSVGEPGDWIDVTTYATNQNVDYNDGYDNQVIYYRLGIKTGEYTSGAAAITLSYAYGSIIGVAKITAFTSSTSVSAVVLSDLGAVSATTVWAEGAWSSRRGYPSAVTIHEGRLWWAGKDKLWGSASDAYYSFGLEEPIGDSSPISRSIGAGPVDTINWLVSAEGLIMGGQGGEFVCRSSSLDEPLTPTNFKIKRGTTVGSTPVDPLIVDASVMFVDRSRARMHELTSETFNASYAIKELTALTPEIGRPEIVRTAVQRKIDTRIHCVRSDGKVAMMIFDKIEEVACWVLIETDGDIEDVVILPSAGSEEDTVYYSVKRIIDGVTQRYLEKWALTSQCEGGTVNRQADSFLHYSGAATQTITGLSHLEGEEVVVWADGIDQGTFTVALGSVTLAATVSEAVVGLAYSATFKSTKLAYAAQGGSALTQRKRLDHLGLILRNTHYQGLTYGDTFDTLDDLPLVEEGQVTPSGTVWGSYDADSFEFSGTYDTDSRLCLKATAPRPCTVLAAVISLNTNEKL